jgi:peptidyl-prolyl cis-trans isomerase A (cyclophilin A)
VSAENLVSRITCIRAEMVLRLSQPDPWIRWTRTCASALALVALTSLLGACGGAEQTEEAAPDTTTAAPPPVNPLLFPTAPENQVEAPDTFRARFETNEGDFVIQVVKAWAPIGANRFYTLVRQGYYDQARFYRAIQGFMVQFGMSADPAITNAWRAVPLQDDPVVQSNARGYVSFATGGPNTRTTQLFINLVDNFRLDESGFAPFGRVVEGMDVVERLYTGYGEGAPNGRGPSQGQILAEGNVYLQRDFPELDYIERATIEEGGE